MSHSKNQNAALGFIFITVLVDVMGFGIILPILPQLISNMVGGDITVAAEYGGALIFVFALMQFLSAPFWGNLSDRYGRRPILLISLFTLGINSIFMAYAPTMFWLFIGRIIGGFTGGGYGVASAYVADITPSEKRSRNFGLLNAAFGLGFIIGPVLGGVLVKYGIHIPFLVAAALSFVNLLYGYFVLPESLSKDKRRAFDWNRANPIGTFIQLKKFPVISGLLLAYTFIYTAGHSMESVWMYYTIEKFGWSEEQIGYSIGFMGLMLALVQGVLVKFIQPRLGDRRSVYVGLIIECIVLVLFSMATQGWMLYFFSVFYALGGISSPALQGIVTNQVPEDSQGELQGGMSSLISITAVISPPIMTMLFAWFSDRSGGLYFPGMPFAFAAFLVLIGLILAIRTLKKG
ncbi:TCR/Tet family MFS transporter [Apibacter sp. HY039]|uniref:TCR/Tet family MFS transporter n=1 Tax=Apibacter sp. HY039 TaxID=2501476 RepID=UPI000FEBAF0A|nr:TCR/Tet family MFS transporter [Apibacter sp. HY039]